MFKRFQNKAKTSAADSKGKADAAKAQTKDAVASAKAQTDSVKDKVEDTVEDAKEKMGDVKDTLTNAAFWTGVKLWIDQHILCCLNKSGEAAKLGAVTDPANELVV